MKSVSRSLVLLLVIAAVVLGIYFLGIAPRLRAKTELSERIRAVGRPSVNVIVAKRATLANEILLPASLQPLQEASIYARTEGYLSQLLVDLGDRVKAGQPLAIIEGPEVDQSLNQARAALEQAQANVELARSSAARWTGLGAQKAVPQQEIDEKQAAFAARKADVAAAEANVSRLTQLKTYQTITAPFDGVISARNVDVGALISQGSSGRELFRLAQTRTLRVYINVPQTYFRSLQAGMSVDVLLNEFPGKLFSGTITRIAGALDAVTRTLVAEIQIPNQNGEILAGMFGQVRLRLTASAPLLVIPSNAVMLGTDGPTIATTDASRKIHLARVKLGRDFGTQVEVIEGLEEGAHVITNPSDSLTEGLEVEPLMAEAGKK
ncbi:MAG: efflux RND transporter periplasmic adaptor subunit [Opitutus sp.]